MSQEDSTRRRLAVVTGGSRGIGRAVAERLAADGCDVAIVYAGNETAAAEAVARVSAARAGAQAAAYRCDVSDADEVKATCKRIVDEMGAPSVLVNDAGITRDGLLMRMSEDDFSRVIDVNLKGAFNCCKAAARPMMKQRYGRIVSMSSVVGIRGNAGQTNYAASKAGIVGLTKSLAKELASRGVTANAVAPGVIATDMTAALSDAQCEASLERIGMGRFGAPEDVAAAVGFLASERASYITGQVICVDGGIEL